MEEVVRNSRSDDPVAAVHDARRRLLAARTARLSLRRASPTPPEPRRGLLARIRKLIEPGYGSEAEGVLDLSRPGAAYDHGQFAVTETGDGIWGGPSGRALAKLSVDPDCRPGPLWFLGAVEFLNVATEDGREDVRDTPCRRFQVSADLNVSADVRSAETSGAMSWRPGPDLDSDSAPLTVWIDDMHLRAVRLATVDQVYTLELWDIGADVTGFDWSRLSTFRTNVVEDIQCRENLV